jgi:hypothetical protein
MTRLRFRAKNRLVMVKSDTFPNHISFSPLKLACPSLPTMVVQNPERFRDLGDLLRHLNVGARLGVGSPLG